MSEQVLLRLFADCENDRQTERIASDVVRLLSAYSPVQTMQPERYWKIPEYFEFCFSLSPASRATFKNLLVAYSPENWLYSGDEQDSSSVWNRSDGNCFLLPEVAWAELVYSN